MPSCLFSLSTALPSPLHLHHWVSSSALHHNGVLKLILLAMAESQFHLTGPPSSDAQLNPQPFFSECSDASFPWCSLHATRINPKVHTVLSDAQWPGLLTILSTCLSLCHARPAPVLVRTYVFSSPSAQKTQLHPGGPSSEGLHCPTWHSPTLALSLLSHSPWIYSHNSAFTTLCTRPIRSGIHCNQASWECNGLEEWVFIALSMDTILEPNTVLVTHCGHLSVPWPMLCLLPERST